MSIIAVIFFGLVLGTLVLRFFKNILTRRRASNISKYITNDSEYAEAICEQLDTPVSKKKATSVEAIDQRFSQEYPFQMGNFTIKQLKKVSADKYLFVTLAKYEDFVRDARGNNYKSTKYFDLNFKVITNGETQEVTVYSDLYDKLVDKNLRRDFASALMSHLEATLVVSL